MLTACSLSQEAHYNNMLTSTACITCVPIAMTVERCPVMTGRGQGIGGRGQGAGRQVVSLSDWLEPLGRGTGARQVGSRYLA